MKEELEQEKAACLEAERSLDALLQRVKEMEGVVEREKEQVRERSGISAWPPVIIFLFIFSN